MTDADFYQLVRRAIEMARWNDFMRRAFFDHEKLWVLEMKRLEDEVEQRERLLTAEGGR